MAERPSGDEERELTRVAEGILPRLIARFGASRLGELEVRQGGWRVRLRRQPDGEEETITVSRRSAKQGRQARSGDGQRGEGSGSQGASASGAASSGGASSGASATSPSSADPASPSTPADRGRVVVTSPAVGYFAPVEGRETGTPIRQGEVLGHVDVLGVRQDVVAAVDGIVGRILAEAGEAVEYGQSLVRIDRIDRLDPARTEDRPAERVPA